MDVGRRLRRIGTQIGVRMYRALDGRLSSGRKDVLVMLLTVPGRRTGLPRSACVRYLDVPEGYVVWGTASGAPTDPDWFRNLRKAEVADVQLRERRIQARPRELLGADRDAMWQDVILAQAPEVARYATKAGRTIPVAVLSPL
jgi:F420H(2)-dependent quinone reductase